MEVAFGPQVADGQAQDGEAVEFREDARLVRQQAGQRVQFGVAALAVPLARVALARTLLGRWFQAAQQYKKTTINMYCIQQQQQISRHKEKNKKT